MYTKKTSQNLGWAYGISAQAFWGSASVVISLVTRAIPTPLLVGLRHAVGTLYLGLNVYAKRKDHIFVGLPWLHLVILGICAGSLPDLLLVESVRHAGPIVAVMLARLEIPLGVLFAHIFLHEKVTKRAYVASLVGVVGAGFISYKPGIAIDLSSGFYFGIIMGVGAGLAWSLSSVYAKYVLNRKSDPLAVTFVRLGLGALVAIILTALFVNNPWAILYAISLRDWLLLLYLGLFASGVGYLLFYRSLNLIDAHVAQILIGVSMVVALALGLVVGVKISALQWIGILVIGYSIYLIKTGSTQKEPDPAQPDD